MARFPGGRRFAFTILDDTDVATVENVAPIYGLLDELGFRTTKTVWPVACPEGSSVYGWSETLEDPPYRAFVLELQRRGFEIAFHGATMESSRRERIVRALDCFRATFGHYPRVHANHSQNRENLYWGRRRLDDPLLKALLWLGSSSTRRPFEGDVPGSPHYWGDLCRQHIRYVRNLTFSEVNTARINPSMPYHDPSRPCVNWWFSATDAENATEFNQRLSSANQQRLEEAGGICILATHLGADYVVDGRVVPETERLLLELSERPGWFVPVGELLDWLRERRTSDRLPHAEWRRMQWTWARDLLSRRLSARRGARRLEN